MITTATTAATPGSKTISPSPLLRFALVADGFGCIALGIAGFPLAGWLASVLGMPAALFLAVSAYLVAFGGAETFVGTRRAPRRRDVVALIALNAMWVLDSAIVLAAGWFSPTTAGMVTVEVLAVGVAGVAALQTFAYRRS